MTYCVAMRLDAGLVFLSDSRTNAGVDHINTYRKMHVFEKPGERVLVLMQDTNDWPVAFLGAMYAGVVPVAVNTLLTADDYAYMLEHSRAQAALVSGTAVPSTGPATASRGRRMMTPRGRRSRRRPTPTSSRRPSSRSSTTTGRHG